MATIANLCSIHLFLKISLGAFFLVDAQESRFCGLIMKGAINHAGDRHGLPNGWFTQL
jgi:hypothetical protein